MRRSLMITVTVAALVVWWPATAGAATGWTIQPTPALPGDAGLFGVACLSPADCTAVGDYTNGSGTQVTLAETWDGSTWAIQPTPNPARAASGGLAGISCLAGDCTAVGSYTDASGTARTLAETWNGSTWAIQPTPSPAGATSSILNAVSCSSAADCTAVGEYTTGSTMLTLAEKWNGTTWAIQPTPNPPRNPDTQLDGVSCPSPRSARCFAIGYYRTSPTGRFVPLAERWTGAGWLIVATHVPAGFLAAISCRSIVFCTAVGSGATGPLADHWDGSTWSAQTMPGPSQTFLSGVSCVSERACTAVGQYYDSAGDQLALAEHYYRGTWRVQATASPAFHTVLNSVACTSNTACVAVGYTLANLTTPNRTVAEHHG